MKYQKIKKETFDAIQIQKESAEQLLHFVNAGPLHKEDVEIFINDMESKGIYIQTLEGTKHASIGDYIIKTDEGYNIMNGPLFDSLYEKVME